MVKRTVVVTGLGAVTAFGSGVEPYWAGLRAGRSMLRPLETPAGPVGDLFVARAPAPFAGAPDRATAMLDAAVDEALAHAGFAPGSLPSGAGIGIGTCQGADRGGGAPIPVDATRHEADMFTRPVDDVAARVGLDGAKAVISTACASSTSAVSWAAAQVSEGRAPVMIGGGVESLCLYALAGFYGLRATSPGRTAPYTRSDGMSLGEGAAVLVLEDLEHARRRGAPILAELLGWGMSSDGYHPVAPDPTAAGALAAARRALRAADVKAEEIDYVNGHGTGTRANDAMEKEAMRLLFGPRAGAVPISSVKPSVGHMLGAAGAIEAVTCVLALRDAVVPPTVEACPDPDGWLDLVPGVARETPLELVLSNSYAFGGINGSIVFGAPHPRARDRIAAPQAPATARAEAVVGGCGSCQDPDPAGEGLACPDFVAPKAWRRMDGYTRRALTAAIAALAEAGIDPLTDPDTGNDAALLFATDWGPLVSGERFGNSLDDRLVPARRAAFAQTTMTSTPGTLAISLGLRGPAATFLTGGGVNALQAVDFGARLVAGGEAPYALVVACDEVTEVSAEALRRWWEPNGPGRCASGAAAVVIESAERAAARGRRPAPVLAGFGHASGPALRGPDADRIQTLMTAARRALAAAGCSAEEVDLAFARALPGPAGLAERDAMTALLPGCLLRGGATVDEPCDLQSASALTKLADAVAALGGRVPGEGAHRPRTALVNAAGLGGSAACLVIRASGEPGGTEEA